MSKIHYFQRYHQKENVVTNNTLLLFSRLYAHSPARFEDFLNLLAGDPQNAVEIGPNFTQQLRSGSSIPDAVIHQSGFKIVIETKLYGQHNIGQLIGHLEAFDHEQQKLLVLINVGEIDAAYRKDILSKIEQDPKGLGVRFLALTFEQIVDAASDFPQDHETELRELVDDYRAFCSDEDLLPSEYRMLRAVTAGYTLDQNILYRLYYQPANRGYAGHQFIGLYANKALRAVGKIRCQTTASYDFSTKELSLPQDAPPLTPEEKTNIAAAIEDAKTQNGWDLSQGNRFFLVDEFHQTVFTKCTSGPMRGTQFFDLGHYQEYIGTITPNTTAEQVAQSLDGKDWK